MRKSNRPPEPGARGLLRAGGQRQDQHHGAGDHHSLQVRQPHHAALEQGHTEVHRMTLEISIHALREEGDAFAGLFIFAPKLFLSTPSARRATQK